MALTVGSRLGHYDVTALIGEGDMGQVYQARDSPSKTMNRCGISFSSFAIRCHRVREPIMIRTAMLKQVISFVTMFTVFPTVAFAQSDVSTDVTKAEIDTVYESLGQSIDKQIKVVDIGKDTNVAIGILERGTLARQAEVGAIVHHDVTEVYYILAGGGTLVTGGPLAARG